MTPPIPARPGEAEQRLAEIEKRWSQIHSDPGWHPFLASGADDVMWLCRQLGALLTPSARGEETEAAAEPVMQLLSDLLVKSYGSRLTPPVSEMSETIRDGLRGEALAILRAALPILVARERVMVAGLSHALGEVEAEHVALRQENERVARDSGMLQEEITALRAEMTRRPQLKCDCGRPLSPSICRVCDNDE